MISNIERKTSTSELLADVSSFVIHLLFLMYIKISFANTGEYYNEMSVDLADYAVIVKGLPREVLGKKRIFENVLFWLGAKDNRHLGYDIFVVPDNE